MTSPILTNFEFLRNTPLKTLLLYKTYDDSNPYSSRILPILLSHRCKLIVTEAIFIDIITMLIANGYNLKLHFNNYFQDLIQKYLEVIPGCVSVHTKIVNMIIFINKHFKTCLCPLRLQSIIDDCDNRLCNRDMSQTYFNYCNIVKNMYLGLRS